MATQLHVELSLVVQRANMLQRLIASAVSQMRVLRPTWPHPKTLAVCLHIGGQPRISLVDEAHPLKPYDLDQATFSSTAFKPDVRLPSIWTRAPPGRALRSCELCIRATLRTLAHHTASAIIHLRKVSVL